MFIIFRILGALAHGGGVLFAMKRNKKRILISRSVAHPVLE